MGPAPAAQSASGGFSVDAGARVLRARRFRALLGPGDRERGLDDAHGKAAAIGTGGLIAPAPGVPSRSPGRPTGAAVDAVAAARRVERLLLGSGPLGGEARIQLGAGPLGGCEIQLRAAGSVIEARLLTHGETSRQTLTVAMNEVAARLRKKGIALDTKTPR